MENKEPAIHSDAENSDSSENLSHDEWTIIGKSCTAKDDDTDDRSNYDELIDEDQGPSRSIELIEPQNDDALDDKTRIVIAEKHCDDSDGISVITESETEQPISNKKFSELNACRNHLCSDLKIYEKPVDKTAPQVGTILNVVIACSLAAIVGLGAGRILGMDDKCPITNAIDFPTLKMESDMLINQIKELNEVKDVLDEIKASIPQVKRKQEKKSHGSKSGTKDFERREEPSIISDTYIFDPDTTILEQLQNSLNTLCSVIDGMNPENDFIKPDTMRTQNVVADLIEFKKIINNVVKELEDAGGQPKEMEFLRHAEKRIRNVCESLLSDLSYTVHGMTMKIHHKLNKVRHKLNKRLCLLKNSELTDGKIFKSLAENDNSFLESCDKILNVTLKPIPKSVKYSKKEKSSKKLSSRIQPVSSSESDDDVYPRDSSSDSSMPDLTYKSDGNKFWRKNLKGEKQAKQYSRKILSKSNSKRRRIRSNKPVKTDRGRSLRKLMTEVLMPPEACPLNKEYLLGSGSAYPEARKLDELPMLNKKPLYSAVLKAETNATTLGLSPEGIKEIDKGFIASANENLTETKDNVTPAKSGINDFETAKSMKEQLNTKIRKPVGTHDGAKRDEETLRLEEISEDTYKNYKQSLKHCRKGKKCSADSSVPTASNKKVASSMSSDSNEQEKSTEKTMNKKSKKQKKGEKYRKEKEAKFDGKVSASSKNNETKKEKGFKKRSYNKKVDDNHLAGDWQIQRSRAREMHRDHDHRSEWFFDRAGSRQDARKNIDANSGSKCYRSDKCEPIFEERIHDEEFYNSWKEAKDNNGHKHSNGRAGYVAKKVTKMPHRKNIMQSNRR